MDTPPPLPTAKTTKGSQQTHRLLEQLHQLLSSQPPTFQVLASLVKNLPARVDKFEQWSEMVITISKEKNNTCLIHFFQKRWSRIERALTSIMDLELTRSKHVTLHLKPATGEGNSEHYSNHKTLETAEEAEGRRIQLEQRVLITELKQFTRSVLEVPVEPVEQAKRLIIELEEENRIGQEKILDAINKRDARKNLFWNYLDLLLLGEKAERILKGEYNPATKFENGPKEKLDWWNAIVSMVDNRPCFIAGSLHKGEGSLVVDVFSQARSISQRHDSVLLIVPRRDEEDEEKVSAEVEETSKRNGLISAQVTLDTPPSESPNVIIAKRTYGLLANLYSLAIGGVLGGGFFDREEHNLCEPLSWGLPISLGCQTFSRQSARHQFCDRLKGLDLGVRYYSPNHTEGLVAEWAELMQRPLSKAKIDSRIKTFINFSVEIQDSFFRGIESLGPDRWFWLEEKGDGGFSPECPYLEEFRGLNLHLVRGWNSALTRKYKKWLATREPDSTQA